MVDASADGAELEAATLAHASRGAMGAANILHLHLAQVGGASRPYSFVAFRGLVKPKLCTRTKPGNDTKMARQVRKALRFLARGWKPRQACHDTANNA